MARITVEDCLKHVDNRFDLVLKAAERAHQLELGQATAEERAMHKPTVLALREIAEGSLVLDAKEEEIHLENAEDRV